MKRHFHFPWRSSLTMTALVAAVIVPGCSPGNARQIPSRPPAPPIGTPSFSHCEDQQRRDLEEHWRDAANAVFEAHDYMTIAPDPEWTAYKSFFDSENIASFRDVVRTCYAKMSGEFQSSSYTIECTPDAVYPNQLPCQRVPPNCPDCQLPDAFISTSIAHQIFICPRYWTKISDDWRRSRYETQIHEMSHWSATCGTKDLFVSWGQAQALANEPATATVSADNYAYFAESHPYPTCTATPSRSRAGGAVPLIAFLAIAPLRLLVRRRSRKSRRRGAVLHDARVELLVLAFAATVGCHGRPPAKPVTKFIAPAGAVSCDMTTEHPEIISGQPVKLRFWLTNATDHALMVCVLGTPLDWPGDYYEIIGPDGAKRPYTSFQSSRGVTRGCYRRIEPRASIDGTTMDGFSDPSVGYDFTQAGAYRITWWPGWLVDVQPATVDQLPPKEQARRPTAVVCPTVSLEVRPVKKDIRGTFPSEQGRNAILRYGQLKTLMRRTVPL